MKSRSRDGLAAKGLFDSHKMKYFAVVEKHATAEKLYCNARADVTACEFDFS